MRPCLIPCLIQMLWFISYPLAWGQQPLVVLPFPQGTAYRCSQGPGGRFTHNTVATQYDFDFALPVDKDVTAAAAGIAYRHGATISGCTRKCVGGPNDGKACTRANATTDCPSGACVSGGFGNHITIDHGNGFFSVYAHLQSFAVSSGQPVALGQKIGTADNSGYSCGDHLHFGLHQGNATKDALFSTSVLLEQFLVKDLTTDSPATTVPGLAANFTCGVRGVGHVYESVRLGITWRASPIIPDCSGFVDASGKLWTDLDFDDSAWTVFTPPTTGPVPDGNDQFFRGTFTLTSTAQTVTIQPICDDGCEAFVNGTLLDRWGNGQCHVLGCVNIPGCGLGFNQDVPPIIIPSSMLRVGKNVIAVHVSNGAGGFTFDMSVSIGQ